MEEYFSKRVLEELENKNISYTTLAKNIKESVETVDNFLRGKIIPTVDMVYKISNYLKISFGKYDYNLLPMQLDSRRYCSLDEYRNQVKASKEISETLFKKVAEDLYKKIGK